MTTERELALVSIFRKVNGFVDSSSYHVPVQLGKKMERQDSEILSIRAVILAQDIWEGRAKQEDWGQQFGEIIPTI